MSNLWTYGLPDDRKEIIANKLRLLREAREEFPEMTWEGLSDLIFALTDDLSVFESRVFLENSGLPQPPERM